MTKPSATGITVRGARTHNLKSIDVDIPEGKLTVVTGPSGAGKSSLAFDTLYAEAQRRFVESLSTQARLVLDRLPRPDVDRIDGLSPSIALQQRAGTRSPRSTLGTVTEIADYLRLLFARLGEVFCPICREQIHAESPQRIVDAILSHPPGTKLTLLAPVARAMAGDLRAELDRLRRDGYARALVDSTVIDLGEVEALDPKRFPGAVHDLDVVIDRLVTKESRDALRTRATDSIELALRVGRGRMRVQHESADGSRALTWHSERFACEKDDFTFPLVEPRLFSFNAPQGACPTCDGLGERSVATEARIVPQPTRTLREGAVSAWGASGTVAQAVELKRAIDATGADADVPWHALSDASRAAILRGALAGKGKTKSKTSGYEGVIGWIDRQLEGDVDESDRLDDDGALDDASLDRLREVRPCEDCGGTRLRIEARSVRIAGKSIAELAALPLPFLRGHLSTYFSASPARTRPIAQPLIDPAEARVGFLIDIGLHYLTLDRAVSSMSSGEQQRMRLATQIASELKGVLYVLDEPTVGLHPRDTERLMSALDALRAFGNTLVVVEHDLGVLRAADHLIDIGPTAGATGGHVVASGTVEEVMQNPKSVTGPFLAGTAARPAVARKPVDRSRVLRLRGASLHNLKSIDVEIPLGVMVAVTGVSGSGKSSLVAGTLLPALATAIAARGRSFSLPSHLRGLEGAEHLDKIIAIDQAPLGRSPRSSPATYTGVMPRLRELFATLPDAKTRGYKPGRFSTNVKGGRCETCRGDGVVRVEMAFLPDVFVDCDECHGARFNRETLEVRFKGRSIADVLAMSVDDAQLLLEAIPAIRERLDALRSLGLGYLALGQPSTTLSGGEAQRVKLSRELARKATGATLYVLDEPTTGLHPVDVSVLVEALVNLRDQGNTVLVIEHDVELVACADWVIDLGPEGGDGGGRLVECAAPEGLVRSEMARFLRAGRAAAHPC